MNHRAEGAQQAVLVDRGHARQPVADRFFGLRFGLVAVLDAGLMACAQQIDQTQRDHRRAQQRIDRRINAIGQARLPQIAIEGAQPVGLPRGKAHAHDQPVEPVILARAMQHRGQRILDDRRMAQHLAQRLPAAQRQHEIMDRTQRQIARFQRGGDRVDHAETEILQRGHDIRQDQRTMALIEFQAQLPFLVAGQAIEAHAALVGIVIGRAGDAAQVADVLRGLGRAIEVAIGNGEGPGIAPGDGGGAARFLAAGDFGLDRIAPSAQHRAQTGVQRRLIGFGTGLQRLVHRQGKAQLGQIGSLDLKAPVDHLAAGGLAQHLGDFVADLGGHRIARQPDEGVEMPFQRSADQRDARARAVDQAHHGQRHTLHIDIGKADHQIMGQAGHRMGQHLARMAVGAEFMLFQQRGELRAHQRHMARRGGQRGAGPYPRMDRERGQLAFLDHRQDEQVERHPAVDMGDPVRFDDQRQAPRPAPRQKLVEPGKAAGIGGRGEQFPRAFPTNAQRAGLRTVAAAHDMAQLRQHPVVEPEQQGGALGPVHRVQGGGIIDHGALNRGPIAHRRAHIAQRDAQRRRNGRARARIRPRGFQIDH